MKKIIIAISILLIFELLIYSETKTASSTWLMYKGDAQNTGYIETKALRTSPKVRWKYNTCTKRFFESVIYENKLITFTNIGLMYVIDPETGKDLLFEPKIIGSPVYIMPYVIGDYLYAYFMDYRFRQGKIIRLNMKTMTIEWEYNIKDEFLSPIVANENYMYLGKNDGTLVAIDIISKQQRWTFKADSGITARPTAYLDYLFVATQKGSLYALDAIDGTVKWQFQAGAGILAPPQVYKNNVISVSLDGKLYVLDLKTGNLKWDLYTETGIVYSPYIIDDTIYVGSSGGQVNAITINNLHLWTYKEITGVGSPMMADNKQVYFADLSGAIVSISREKGEFLWKTRLDSIVSSSILIKNSSILFSASDYLYAIDSKTGNIKWFRKLPCEIYSSPVIDDSQLYFGTWDGKLYAFVYKIGKYEWYHQSYGYVYSTPIILPNGIGYESTDNKFRIVDNKGKQELFSYNVMATKYFSPKSTGDILILDGLGYLVAYDLKQNKELWRTEQLDIQKWKVYTTPAIGKDIVVYGSNDQNCYALSLKDGKSLWTFKTEGTIRGAPAISKDTVFCPSADKNLYALNLKNGKLKWKFTSESYIMASPSIAYNTIYIGSYDKYMYALNEKTGSIKWKFLADDSIDGSATIADNTVYFGTKAGSLYALDATTGKELWNFKTSHAIITAPLVKDGIVYITSSDGYIYALEQK